MQLKYGWKWPEQQLKVKTNSQSDVCEIVHISQWIWNVDNWLERGEDALAQQANI